MCCSRRSPRQMRLSYLIILINLIFVIIMIIGIVLIILIILTILIILIILTILTIFQQKARPFFLKQSSLMENWIRCAWNPTWSHFRFLMWNLKPLVTDLIILTTRLKCLWVHMESLVIWWLSRGETHNQNLMQPIPNQSVYWKYVGSSHFRACAFYIFRETGTHVT